MFSSKKIIHGLLLVIVVLLVIVAFMNFGDEGDGLVERTLAPDFTLETLEGGNITLSELRGRPVFLEFWTTWCVSCGKQMPYVQAAFEEVGGEVEFIAINIKQSSDVVQKFVEERGLGFTIALDSEGSVADIFKARYIPINIVIDKNGVIQYKKVGAFSSTEELMDVLNSVL